MKTTKRTLKKLNVFITLSDKNQIYLREERLVK